VEWFPKNAFECRENLEFFGREIHWPACDDDKICVGQELLGLSEEFKTVHSRHRIVGDDHARVNGDELLKGLKRAGKRMDLAGEVSAEELTKRFED